MLFVVLLMALATVNGPSQPGADRRPEPRFSVSGRLVAHDRKPLLSGTVVMSPESGRPSAIPIGEARLQPDGLFTFHDVPSGRYLIRARGETADPGTSLFGTFAVAVGGRDVDRIEMTLRPGAVLAGEVEFQARHGTARPPLASLRVHAPLPDGSTFGEAGGGAIRADGRFSIEGVIAGTHVLVVRGLVFPWRVAAARVFGRDALERAFDVDTGQQVRGIRVLLTDTAAGVSGRVLFPSGVAPRNVLVIAFPDDPLRRALPLRFVRVGRVSAEGSFRVVDLAPGRYRVVAALHATEHDALDPAVLDRYLETSTPVTLAEARVSPLEPLQVAGAAPGSPSR